MITLMYIVGISRTDTPIFNNAISQQEWFNNNAENVRKVDTIFPPYYTNRIRLSDDDINFDSTYNYLILTFRNINYYYFIKDFHYVNEGLIDIDIEMDTFQTLMFNINYHNARIRRRSIKRYLDKNHFTINRNYIRENYNSNEFVNKEYINYTYQEKFLTGFGGFIIAKSADLFWAEFKDITLFDKQKIISDNVRILLIPAMCYIEGQDKYLTGKHEHIFDTTSGYIGRWDDDEIRTNVKELQSNNAITNMFYIPFNPFKDISITTEYYPDNLIPVRVKYQIPENNRINMHQTADKKYLQIGKIDVSPQFRLVELPYSQSAQNVLGAPFSSNYVPQLLDENYVQIKYGERLDNTSLPLSKITNTALYLYRQCDILTGCRIYWIVDKEDLEDKYFTKIVVQSREDVSMFNDYFKQYVNGNKGTLFIGNTLGSILNGIVSPNPLMSVAQDATATATELVNKAFQPKTMAQDNSMTSSLIGETCDEVYTLDVATNIDAVATIYESIGYLVDEFVLGAPIFKDRQIYNYVECEEIDLSLMNAISSDELINDIRTRFMDGMRLWNTDTMKTLNDNNKPISLGDVCKYDNIEVW